MKIDSLESTAKEKKMRWMIGIAHRRTDSTDRCVGSDIDPCRRCATSAITQKSIKIDAENESTHIVLCVDRLRNAGIGSSIVQIDVVGKNLKRSFVDGKTNDSFVRSIGQRRCIGRESSTINS